MTSGDVCNPSSGGVFSARISAPFVYWVQLLGCCLVTIAWAPRLFRSFWVDEAGTFCMSHSGISTAIAKALGSPGQSILYGAIASFFCIESSSFREIWLRVPTLLGIACCCYFLFWLAEQAIGPGTGFATVILFLLHPSVIVLGTQARPYGLALAAAVGSCWMLFKWVEERRRRWLIGYSICSAFVIYLHYMFAPLFLAQAIYLLFVLIVERRASAWKEMALVIAITATALLPLKPHMLLLMRSGSALPFSGVPSTSALIDVLSPSLLVFGAFGAAILMQLIFPGSGSCSSRLSRSSLLFVSCWWAVPIFHFALSFLASMNLMVSRYVSFSAPATVLLMVHFAYSVFDTSKVRIWVVAAVALSTASPFAMTKHWRVGEDELGPAFSVIRSEDPRHLAPVIFRSELPESNYGDWRNGTTPESWIRQTFSMYSVWNPIICIPYTMNEEAKAWMSSVIDDQFHTVQRVILLTREDVNTERWMRERMKAAGFTADVHQPNAFMVIVFSKLGVAEEHTTISRGFLRQDDE